MSSLGVCCSTLLAPWLLLGCVEMGEGEDAKAPGDQLGTFAVRGELKGNSCGTEAFAAQATWDFSVKLSRAGSTLYWLNGREAIVGDIDRSGDFQFDTRLDFPLESQHGAVPGCTVVRRDTADGTLTSSGKSFSGTLEFSYAALATSECENWLGQSGTPEVLPCRVAYDLDAAREAEE